MIRNEDIFIEQALRNVVDFCDHIYVDDNLSKDQTPEILRRLADEFDTITVRTIDDTIQSNDQIEKYFGTDTWVFAIDGDELYDAERLVEMRQRLEAGEFDKEWLIFGSCLHVTHLSDDKSVIIRVRKCVQHDGCRKERRRNASGIRDAKPWRFTLLSLRKCVHLEAGAA